MLRALPVKGIAHDERSKRCAEDRLARRKTHRRPGQHPVRVLVGGKGPSYFPAPRRSSRAPSTAARSNGRNTAAMKAVAHPAHARSPRVPATIFCSGRGELYPDLIARRESRPRHRRARLHPGRPVLLHDAGRGARRDPQDRRRARARLRHPRAGLGHAGLQLDRAHFRSPASRRASPGTATRSTSACRARKRRQAATSSRSPGATSSTTASCAARRRPISMSTGTPSTI